MLDYYPLVKHAFTLVKQRIPSLKTIEQKSFSILKIMIFFLSISFFIIVIFWIFNEEGGIIVHPFETVGIGENLNGNSLATLLSFDLQNIKQIYEPPQDIAVSQKSASGNMIITRPLEELYINSTIKSASNTPLEYSLSQAVIVGTKGTSLSIGNLLLPIKEFIGNNKADVITGSVQRYNSSIIALVLLEDRHSSKVNIIPFEHSANISQDEEIPSFINDIAFMIAHDLSKRRAQKGDDPNPQTWQAFKYVTQGRDAYNKYVTMKNINELDKMKYLDKGRTMALLATKFEPGYKKSLELLSALGFAYIERREYEKAAEIFKYTYEFNPFDSTIGLGLVYGMQGHYAEALKAFDDATQIDPQNAGAWNYKGLILSRRGNYSEAVNAFKNATKLDSNFAIAWKYEGDALACLGANNSSMYGEAIQAYDKAIELNEQDALVWKNKGTMLYNLRKYEEAIKAYNETIKLNSSYADAWYGVGESLFALGKNDDARVAYNKAIQINPHNRNAAVALEKLA